MGRKVPNFYDQNNWCQRMKEQFLISPFGTFNLIILSREDQFNFHWYREGSGIFHLDKLLYISGGKSKNTRTQFALDTFLTLNQKLSKKQCPLLEKKYYHLMTGHRGTIIISGGQDHNKEYQSAQNFDTHARKWNNLPLMNYSRKNHSSCIVDKVVFCFFGSKENSIQYLKYKTSQEWVEIEFKYTSPKYETYFAVPLEEEILVFTKTKVC